MTALLSLIMITPQAFADDCELNATVATTGGSGLSPIQPPPMAAAPVGQVAIDVPIAQLPAPYVHRWTLGPLIRTMFAALKLPGEP